MKMFAIILSFLCVSCVQLKYSATTKLGTETIAYNSFGGSGALDSAGGTRLTHNHVKTAGQFFQTVATVAGTVAAGYVQNSDNALTATQSTNATRQAVEATRAKAAQSAAETAAKSAATSEAIKAGATLTPITINPP